MVNNIMVNVWLGGERGTIINLKVLAMNRIYILLIFNLLFFAASGTAQNNIPTLKAQLQISNADSCQLYFELGKVYEEVNLDSCFYYLHTSLDIAERKNNAKGKAQAMYRIGYNYTYFIKNDEKAIKWLNKAIVVAKQENDNAILAKAYGSLAILDAYYKNNMIDELLSKAVYYAKKTNDWEVLIDAYDNITSCRVYQKKYKEAEEALLNAMKVCENHSPDNWLSFGLDYTELLKQEGRKEEAFAFCQKLNGIRNQLKHSKGEFVYTMDIARLETNLKNYSKADSTLQYALKMEKAKTKPDTFHLLIIIRNILDVSIYQGNSTQAAYYVNELVNIRVASKERRLTQDSKVQMTELKSALDLEQKDSEIALLDEQKKNQRLYMIAAMVIALLLGGFMLILQRNKRRIEHQKAELTAINATKDKLFSIISHDLRSPIGLLKGHLMMTNYGAMSQEEFSVASKRLSNNVNALFQTLDNLLHWSYSQQKGIEVKPENISLHAIANEEIQFLTEIAHQKGIDVVNDIAQEATAFADRNQIGLVIRNLMSNSLKFTHSGGKIVLKSENTEGGKTILKISDNGIGMPQTLQNQLFKIQSNASRQGTSEEKGQGLGLILVKEMVEANGGTLHIESAENQGTVIRIVL